MPANMPSRNIHIDPCFTRYLANREFIEATFERNLWRCLEILHTRPIRELRIFHYDSVDIGNCCVRFEIQTKRNRVKVMSIAHVQNQSSHIIENPVSFTHEFSQQCAALVANPDLIPIMVTEFWEQISNCHACAPINNRKVVLSIEASRRSPCKLTAVYLETIA